MKRFFTLLIVLCVVNGARAQSCIPDYIQFEYQSQIDNFQANYPNCTRIDGDVLICGDNITNLNGLNVLTSIGGDLYIEVCSPLNNLTGLNNITSIGGNLTIGYDFTLNPYLTSLSGLDNLTSVGGYLIIYNNFALTSLMGLDVLTSIGGELFIYNNPALTSMAGIGGLTSIGGNLIIYGNPVLTGMAGIEDLTSIGGNLEIEYNYSLASLTGLDNLTSIGGGLRVYGNPALTSLAGLDKIDGRIINNLTIVSNASLCDCAVQSICCYLSSPVGTIDIRINAAGCNSRQEVEDACAASGLEALSPGSSLAIYPNPASIAITIETTAKGRLSILNLHGNQLLHREITKPVMQFDISTLSGGVYFVRLTNEKTVEVGKFIKQ
jgi:hypothetical protein